MHTKAHRGEITKLCKKKLVFLATVTEISHQFADYSKPDPA